MNGIERLIAALCEIDLVAESRASMLKLGAEDIADIAWLLMYMDQKQKRQQITELQPHELAIQNTVLLNNERTESLPTKNQKEEKLRFQLERGAARNVYLRSQSLNLHREQNAVLLRIPSASALPGSLDIARALRPLMRYIPSPTHFIIDELATAHRIAETQKGLWSPVLKAAPMRWLEIALVVDIGASMAPWQQTIDELRILLEHHGAFSDVRIWRLVTDVSDYLHLYAGVSTDTQQERNPKELIDPSGRRLILVVTDCVSNAWHSGKAQEMLDLWGHSNVVTILQVFPKRLWIRTALCNADIVQVRATALNRGNAGMSVLGNQVWFNDKNGDEEVNMKSSLPLPIITLEPKTIANWANMIAGVGDSWTPGVVFYRNLPSMPSDAPFVQEHLSSPKDLVRQFRAVASTIAFRLLSLLSAVPVSFPVIRLIQQTMLPQAQQVHVAEIFLSGLLEEVSRDVATNDPNYVEYDFLPGVREVIRETVAIPDEFQVIEAVSAFLGSRYGHLRDFLALAATPSTVEFSKYSIKEESRPFAKIVASVWQHIGGMYETLADNLEQYIDEIDTKDAQNVSLPLNVHTNIAPELNLPDEHNVLPTTKMSSYKKYSPNLRLRQARMERGWSQKELAERVGTNDVNVNRWENGVTSPSPYFRIKLHEVLGKTAAELGLKAKPHYPRVVSLPKLHNPLFTGGDELLALLHERLATSHTAALTQAQALFGLGGVGKTQTAFEYAYTYSKEYTSVFWIRAATRDTLVADYVALAERLGLSKKGEQDQSRMVAAVKTWLEIQPNWLLILDNVDDLSLAQEFLPDNHDGYVLLTTRTQVLGPFAENIEVDQLSVQDGSFLLLSRSKLLKSGESLDELSSGMREAAERIVREMDGLPLALIQIGAYIEETGCSLTDYLDIYAAHRKEHLARRSELSQLPGYPEAVDTTWAISFQQVAQQSATAADILNLCAFLAPDAIPEELFTRGAAALGTLPVANVADAHKLNEALKVLRRYSLVRRNSNAHILTIHRLVQTVLQEHMDEETQRAWAERTVRLVNAAFPDGDYGAGTNHQYYLQYYLPHVQECATLIEHYHLYFPEAAQLLYQAGAFLYANSLYTQSEALHRQAISIREQIVGTDHPATADSLNYLALLSRLRGDNEQAEKFHLQALAIRKKTLGAEHPKTASSLNNLSVLYRNQGKYEQAESLLQQALSIRNQTLGSDHPDTLTTTINLGRLYLEQGKYEQAEQFLKQSLVGFERIMKSDHPLFAQNLHLLATLYYKQAKYEQAEGLWQRAIVIIEKTLGAEHLAVAESLNGLAELYVAQGRYEEAEALYQRALAISEKTLGAGHIDTLTYRRHLTEIMSKRAY